jgi:hypothetical protein
MIGTEAAQPFDPPSMPGDLTVSIRDTVSGVAGVSNGYNYFPAPRTIPAANDLASAVVPAASIPASPPNTSITVIFANPPQVTAGKTYAIVVGSGGTARHDWAISISHNVDGYSGGSIFFTAQGGWDDYGYQPNLSPAGGVDYYDTAFQTTVFGCPGL